MADIPDLDLSKLGLPSAEWPSGSPRSSSPKYDLRQTGPVSNELHVRAPQPLRPFQTDVTAPVTAPPAARPIPTEESALYAPGAPAAGENSRQVGEQTIEIAPHPTTNRFPWAPVQNPTVAVYQTVSVPPPIPRPAESVVASVEPPQLKPVPIPELKPRLLPVAESLPVPVPTESAMPTLALKLAPAPEPSKPEPQTTPVRPPEVVPAPVARLESIPEAKPSPVATTKPAPKPPRVSKHDKDVESIYSDYTKEVWHVFRPNQAIRTMFFLCLFLVIAGAVAFWWFSGRPNILSLKILQPILHST